MAKIEVTADTSQAKRDIDKLNQAAARGGKGAQTSDRALAQARALERSQANAAASAERMAKAYERIARDSKQIIQNSRSGSAAPMPGPIGGIGSPPISPPGTSFLDSRVRNAVRHWQYRPNRNGGLFGGHGMVRMSGAIGAGIGAVASGGFSTGGAIGTLGSMAGGALGSVFGPAGMMVGSAIGGGLGGAVDGGMSNSYQAAQSASLLRATLGQVANSFSDVQEAASKAGHGLGLTRMDVLRLGTSFSKTSGSTNIGDVTGSVRDAAGFGRGLGLSDDFTTHFFAQLRQAKVTMSPEDSRRMGGIVAEGIIKGGGTAKSEEFMGAVSNFMSTQMSHSMAGADVEGFSSVLSALTGRGGMDTGVAGGLLNRADSGIRNHGSMAVESFKLGTAQRMYGNDFSALDLKSLEQGGMFSTAGKSLGEGSAMMKLAESIGDKGYLRRVKRYGNGGAFGLGLVHDAVRTSGGNAQIAVEQISALFPGLNQEQSAALANAAQHPEQLGALKNMGNMSMKNMGSAAQVLGATDGDLRKMAAAFASGDGIKNKLSDKNASELSELGKSGGTEALRNALINTLKNVEVTDRGQDMAATSADIKEVTMAITDKLIPAVEAGKEAMLWLGGDKQKEFMKHQENVSPEVASSLAKFKTAQSKYGASYQGLATDAPPEVQAKLRAEMDAARKEVESSRQAYRKRTGLDGGSDSHLGGGSVPSFDMNAKGGAGSFSAAIMGAESGGRRYDSNGNLLTSPKGAKGEMQVLDSTNGAPGFGVTPARDNSPDERARVGRDYAAAMRKRYGGNISMAAAGYNAGPGAVDAAKSRWGDDWLAHMPKETRDYVGKVAGQWDQGVPEEGRRAKNESSVSFNPATVDVRLFREDGRPASLPIPVTLNARAALRSNGG